MTFSDAFLSEHDERSIDARIADNVDVLMQSVAPELVVPPELNNTKASSLCFGIPMNWALNDADRQAQVRRTLKDRLERFEPRLGQVRNVGMAEDAMENLVQFTISAQLAADIGADEVELQTRLSLFDQKVAAGT